MQEEGRVKKEIVIGDFLVVSNIEKLVEIVGFVKPICPGPLVIQVRIWDGRRIMAHYHECEAHEVDAMSNIDVFWNSTWLEPLIDRLIEEGTPFITRTMVEGEPRTLCWTIGK